MTLIELAELFIESRNFYVGMGWKKDDCAVGYFDGMLKLACDSGASTYRCHDDGLITRDAIGVRSKLIEFVETDVQDKLTAFNRMILDRRLMGRSLSVCGKE